MTKADLIKKLESLDDDAEIVISYQYDNDWHDIDQIKLYQNNHKVMLQTNENPSFESLQCMAEGLYQDEYENKTDNHEDKMRLEDFIE